MRRSESESSQRPRENVNSVLDLSTDFSKGLQGSPRPAPLGSALWDTGVTECERFRTNSKEEGKIDKIVSGNVEFNHINQVAFIRTLTDTVILQTGAKGLFPKCA